ncbi:MAG: carboxylesterase family protein [Alphaproteobacteria bacterium]
MAQDTTYVTVAEGVLHGLRDGGTVSYRNIPFAAPPIGKLRFAPPSPPLAWRGVRDASHFGPTCPQLRGIRRPVAQLVRPFSHYLARIIFPPDPLGVQFQATGGYDEDCLNLNIWTAVRPKANQPVVLFLHGGGFYQGGGNAPIQRGTSFARSGVIFVSMNYRLGAAGFLAIPELAREQGGYSGNYALLDVLAALRWLRHNASAFGGDPAKITVMGQSAGGALAFALLHSPQSQGLFRGVIIQSGIRMTPPWMDRSASEKASMDWVASKASPQTLQTLRRLPAAALTAEPGKIFQLGLTADGHALHSNNPALIMNVPIMTGWNKDEGVVPKTFDFSQASACDRFSTELSRLLRGSGKLPFPPYKCNPHNLAALRVANHEELLMSGAEWARTHGKLNPLYFYDFEHVSRNPAARALGAYHGAELPYVFDSLNELDAPSTSEDQGLARLVHTYWLNFIKNGDPNSNGLPKWHAFEKGNNRVMALSRFSHMRPIAKPDRPAD